MKITYILILGLLITGLSCTSSYESNDKENAVEYLRNYQGNTIGLRTNKKLYGFVSKDGKVIIKPQYDYFTDFKNGIAFIGIGKFIENDNYNEFEGKTGIIDSTGKILFAPQFDEIELYDRKIGVYKKKEKYGFFKTDGTFLTDTLFEDANLFYHNLACVKIKNKYGFIDTTGQLVILNKFDFADDFHYNAVAIVAMNEKYGIIDSTGAFILQPTYEKIEPFSNDIAYFIDKKLYGILNYKGQIVQKAKFKDKSYATDNYERVCDIKDKWGLIDENGNIVIEMKYDKIRPDPKRTKISFWTENKETSLDLVDGRLKMKN